MIKYVKEQIEELLTKDEMKDKISMALKDPVLQQGFEIICKNLAELEKENAELKASRETKWHDLKKDPSDLPEPYATVLDEDGNKITYRGESEWTFYSDYYEMDIEAIKPVAWCEIPTFKV